MVRLKTRDFGVVEVDPADIITFLQPPFGFEQYTSFALIHNEEVGEQVVWLQSLQEASVCFILFDPSGLSSFYNPHLTKEVIKSLGEGELLCWVIGVVPADFNMTTVNLKSPIIINRATRKGVQVILEQDYAVRHYLMQEAQ